MISILDPNSRIGRDLAAALAERSPELRQRYYHTDEHEEHLITEIAGEAAIVSRLGDLDELAGSKAVVVTTTLPDHLALALLAWLRANPAVALVDLSQPGLTGEVATTVLDSIPAAARPRWFHLVDPALIGPARVIRALAPLQPREVTITATRPASAFGDEALHELAAQAAARLSGVAPGKASLLPGVLAFDLPPATEATVFAAQRQVSVLFPGVATVVHLLDAGIFHGHTATLTLRCESAADIAQVRHLLRAAPGVTVARAGSRLGLGDLDEVAGVLCGELRTTGAAIALWVAADGLRLAASELAPELVGDVSVLVS